jgi:hypothetical protein
MDTVIDKVVASMSGTHMGKIAIEWQSGKISGMVSTDEGWAKWPKRIITSATQHELSLSDIGPRVSDKASSPFKSRWKTCGMSMRTRLGRPNTLLALNIRVSCVFPVVVSDCIRSDLVVNRNQQS